MQQVVRTLEGKKVDRSSQSYQTHRRGGPSASALGLLWAKLAFWRFFRRRKAERLLMEAVKELQPRWIREGLVRKPN